MFYNNDFSHSCSMEIFEMARRSKKIMIHVPGDCSCQTSMLKWIHDFCRVNIVSWKFECFIEK